MTKYAIQQVRTKIFLGELTPNGINSRVTPDIDEAKKFDSMAAAESHITYCIKHDAGITSRGNVTIVAVQPTL